VGAAGGRRFRRNRSPPHVSVGHPSRATLLSLGGTPGRRPFRSARTDACRRAVCRTALCRYRSPRWCEVGRGSRKVALAPDRHLGMDRACRVAPQGRAWTTRPAARCPFSQHGVTDVLKPFVMGPSSVQESSETRATVAVVPRRSGIQAHEPRRGLVPPTPVSFWASAVSRRARSARKAS
jgi:hypothetical protein